MNRIALIAFYFGKFPNYFQMWLDSIAGNKNIDVLLYSDFVTEGYNYPQNVIKKRTSFTEMKIQIQKLFDFEVCIPDAYKIADFRAAFGLLFKEDLQNYEFWGTCDIDVVWGDFSKFVTNELLEKYDKIFVRDHLTIYRNTEEVNRRFMFDTNDKKTPYVEAFTSPNIFCFSELSPYGVVRVWEHNNWEYYRNDDYIADINYHKYHFSIVNIKDVKYRIFTYQLVDGKSKLFSHKIVGGQVITEEFLYIHLQKRNMEFDEKANWNNGFIITANKFIPPAQSTFAVKEIKKIIGVAPFIKDKFMIPYRAFFKIKRKLKIKRNK